MGETEATPSTGDLNINAVGKPGIMRLPKPFLIGVTSLGMSGTLAAQPQEMPLAPPARMPDPDAAFAPGIVVPPGQMGPLIPVPAPPPPMRRRDVSWIYIDRPRPRKVGVHDIVTVVVDEKSEMLHNTRFNRQRNAIFKAQLKEFIKINEKGNLDNAALNSPTIDAQLRSQLQSFGQSQTQEGLKYRIAATVVDLLPNGTLVLEARKSIHTPDDVWEYRLTGRIRTQDILGNNTVLSENIAELKIEKNQVGKVEDSSKRGILGKLYDYLLPF
jgi:flagellar L-ring protein precursor FlgH